MTYTVLTSDTFRKQFRNLDRKLQNRIRKSLTELESDPFKPRSGADIKRIEGTDPPKHRLRVGGYRIIYRVVDDIVKVIEIFPRGRDCRE